MQLLDWLVLIGTTAFITIYGIWKTRNNKNVSDYLLSRKMKWYTVGLSIMATQASAITFLSTPGQAYTDGMRFVQFYFGLPLAMIFLSAVILPLYRKLNVYTAYEFLEHRFDLKTRALGAFLFLVQRGLAAGLTIYAPSLILSSILGWDIYILNIILGGMVIIYTVAGGTEAVSQTQTQQMAIIFLGMLIAGIVVFNLLPADVSFFNVLQIAGKMDRLEVLDFKFDFESKYNIWSGIIGGFFLQLSYFGTDQSQVQRYLGGKSLTESRLGLLFNGFIKIPMQFLVLLIGTMVFIFYQFQQPPIFFNRIEIQKIYESESAQEFKNLEKEYAQAFGQKKESMNLLVEALHSEKNIENQEKKLKTDDFSLQKIRKKAINLIHENNLRLGNVKANDTNYIFLTFVMNHLPTGIIGLLIAVILAASMSSTASELNALASTSVIDVYKRSIKKNESEAHYVKASKWATVFWGMYAIVLAEFANKLSGNLIEAVNILGSLFYGTILGIFLTAFFLKKVGGNVVFYAAVFAELVVFGLWYANDLGIIKISYLWYNLIGCFLVLGISHVASFFWEKQIK